jgi:hypothetical protein
MLTLISALLVGAAVIGAAVLIARAIRAAGQDQSRARVLGLLAMFGPAVSAANADPRAILVWQPLASTARRLFPEEFAQIDAAAGSAFPFSRERLEAAHAHWTADWLAWERTHDSEYKLKAALAEQELVAAGPSSVLRARLEAVEREKLELYQRRYQEYVRVAKALQALA